MGGYEPKADADKMEPDFEPLTTLRYTWSASKERQSNGVERLSATESVTERVIPSLNDSLDVTSTTTTTTQQLPGASFARGGAADPLASGEPIRIPRRPQTGNRSARRSHAQMSVRRSATMFTPRGTTPIGKLDMIIMNEAQSSPIDYGISFYINLFQFAVVDGDDMTRYDDVGTIEIDNDADLEAIDDLELELASQTGRMTGANFSFFTETPECPDSHY